MWLFIKKEEVIQEINKALEDSTIGILLITEKLGLLVPELIDDIKMNRPLPLVVEIPDRHGTERASDSITRYVRDAVGLKL